MNFTRNALKRTTLVAILSAIIAVTIAPSYAGAATSSGVVSDNGRYIGQDPDANVRFMLKRDAGSENY